MHVASHRLVGVSCTLLFLLTVLCLCGPSLGQAPAAKPAEPTAKSAAPAPKPAEPPAAKPAEPAAAKPAEPPAAKPEAGDDDKEKEKSLREQSIYIPYEKLRKVFEKEGRGVFLPYEKFRELWQAAQDKKAAAAEAKPPVGALITEIENEATVSKDVVRVKAILKIEVLAEGWNEVPLRLSDAAITEATIAGQPARIVSAGPAGYKLLLEKKGQKPEQIELRMEYAKAISRAPGLNSVSFEAPQVAVSRWQIRIPESGVKVNVEPLVAATEVAAPPPAEKKPAAVAPAAPGTPAAPAAPAAPEETVVRAYVGAAPTVHIKWTPKAEGATGLEALATVQAEQQAEINEGIIRTQAQLAYAVSRSELRQLALEVPADQKVVNVFDPNVRQWSVEQAGQTQKVNVQLFEPAKQAQTIIIKLERYFDQKQQGSLQVPVVRALGTDKALVIGRQQGVVVVQVAEGLRGEVARSGALLQVDAAELPPSLARGPWAFAYRYAAVPFDLVLSVEKVQPRIVVDSLVEADLQPERLTLDVLAIYNIQRAGVFRVEWDLPPGYEVRQVRGRAAAGAAEAQVDTYHVDKEKNRLVVNLGRRAFGRVGLVIQVNKELREPDLASPTGKAAQIPVEFPRVPRDTVERSSGRLLIYAPESLRVNPAKPEGPPSISFKEALEGMESVRQPRPKPADSRPVLAFAFTQEPISLALAAERRKPQVTVRQLLVARIEEGVVKYKATLFYSVLYSGVKHLRVDLPAKLVGQVRNVTPGIREKVIDSPAVKPADGYVAWSLAGETELVGDGKIELTWEETISKLDVGGSIPIKLPELRPREVDRAWGQIVLAKAETVDIQDDSEKQEGLRVIDPQTDLMPGAEAPGAARAFEFHGDRWALTVTATRYQLQDVKQTAVERALLRMVVTRAKKITVQALYRMKSTEQRLAIRLPEKAKVDSQPRVNGKAVTLEVGAGGDFFVPLVGTNPDEPFLLELQYWLEGDGSRLEYPDFPAQPAVHKVYLAVYLPQEWALLAKRGPWSEELSWRVEPGVRWKALPNKGEGELIPWLIEASKLAPPAESFPIDGRMYLFSALRPPAPEEGMLKLTAIHEDWLHGIVIGVLAVGGLILLASRAWVRLVAVGSLVIGLVICGVFWPMFARQVLDGYFAAAMAVVLVIWATQFGARTRLSWLGPRGPAAKPPTAGSGPEELNLSDSEGLSLSGEPPKQVPPAGDDPQRGQDKGGPAHA